MAEGIGGGLALVFGPSRAAQVARELSALAALSTAVAAAQLWYFRGAILLIVTASRRPAETLFELRLARNLRVGSSPEAAEAAAAAGLSGDGDGRLRCFHCGAEVPADSMAEAAHAAASPDCSVGRLGAALGSDGAAEVARLVSANSERSRRALQRLSRELDNRDRVIAMAESFGFGRGSLAFAATRHFMLNGGQLPDKPGGFIECLLDCERQFSDSARIVGLFSVDSLMQLLGPTEVAQAAPPASAAAPPSAPAPVLRVADAVGEPDSATAGDSGSGNGNIIDSGSDRCVVCVRRCRDRVLLPCAHFCACSECLSSRSRCPTCGSSILATVRAFIT